MLTIFIHFASLLTEKKSPSVFVQYLSYSSQINTDIFDLLFERFLNPERVTMPDIDTDFPDIYRDKVIDYVVNKYGEKRVCGIVTFGTLASKQALRDVGRILNIPSYQIDMITKRIPTVTKLKLIDFYQQDNEFKRIIDSDNRLKKLYQISSFLEGFPRHTSIHAAGIVMCQKDLDEVIPLRNGKPTFTTINRFSYH